MQYGRHKEGRKDMDAWMFTPLYHRPQLILNNVPGMNPVFGSAWFSPYSGVYVHAYSSDTLLFGETQPSLWPHTVHLLPSQFGHSLHPSSLGCFVWSMLYEIAPCSSTFVLSEGPKRFMSRQHTNKHGIIPPTWNVKLHSEEPKLFARYCSSVTSRAYHLSLPSDNVQHNKLQHRSPIQRIYICPEIRRKPRKPKPGNRTILTALCYLRPS